MHLRSAVECITPMLFFCGSWLPHPLNQMYDETAFKTLRETCIHLTAHMHDYSKRRGSRPDLKFAHATLFEKGGYPGSQNHVAANGEWCVHQKIEPVGIVGGFLEPKRHMSLFNPQAWYFLSAYKNVNVAKPDAAVSDE